MLDLVLRDAPPENEMGRSLLRVCESIRLSAIWRVVSACFDSCRESPKSKDSQALSMRSRMSIYYLILRRRVPCHALGAVPKDVPQARMPFSADKETCMSLWTIDASAVSSESRWQDFPIWAGDRKSTRLNSSH